MRDDTTSSSLQIRDATDFNRHVNYVHCNPVKHGYAANPLHWPHSSLHHFAIEKRETT